MILEKQSQAHVLQEGEQTQESIGMSLDLDSAQILMQMLSKNLYSDDIGSTIRECASNALDSHRRAGTTDPIVVSFQIASDNNNYEFTVEDFGIGLDADDVKNIISKYGKSTKRDSANELGMMGLGFKAPLAYSSSFYFVARKNGVERKYMMYEGEDVNTIDLLYETPTTQRNGVKIIVPVSYYDRSQFYTKIREQLAYFENVYFNVNDIDNNFVIYRNELFQWSELASDGNLHVCLDNVYYPLDFKKLGIDSVRFPIALRLGLSDGVFPTPNRESLRYTKEAMVVIMNKIKHIANYFVEKYNESVKDTENILEAIDHYRSHSKYVKLKKDGGNVDVNGLKSFATIPFASPKVKGLDYLTVQY
jgi:anti-sigma regulatory factor (Ser/Thr protein kinase)